VPSSTVPGTKAHTGAELALANVTVTVLPPPAFTDTCQIPSAHDGEAAVNNHAAISQPALHHPIHVVPKRGRSTHCTHQYSTYAPLLP